MQDSSSPTLTIISDCLASMLGLPREGRMKISRSSRINSNRCWLQCFYRSPLPCVGLRFKSKLPGGPVVKVLFQSQHAGFSIQMDSFHPNKLTIFQSLKKNTNKTTCEPSTPTTQNGDPDITKGIDNAYLHHLYKGLQIWSWFPINFNYPLESIETISMHGTSMTPSA